MKLPFRRILRIVISIVLLVLLWSRAAREWRGHSSMWLFGSISLSVILLLVLLMEVTGAQQKWRKERDEVPKKPLGL